VRATLRGLISAVGHAGHSVPSTSTHQLVERPALQTRIADAIGMTGCGPVVLAGPGGMGKTTAAIDAAERAMKSDGCGVVRWMTAATLADLESAWQSLGADLGVAGLRDVKDRRVLVRRVVTEGLDRTARGSWLLVFDNVESLTDELRELMPVWADVKTARAHVMVTTRDRTGWSASHGKVIDVGEMGHDEAINLLAERAGVDRNAPEHAGALLAMVERLDGHPLALMQVGALISGGNLSMTSFLEELEHQNIAIDRLADGSVDRPEGTAHPTEGSVYAALGKILEVAISRIGESGDERAVDSTKQLLETYAVMNPDRIEDAIFQAGKDGVGQDIQPFPNFSISRNTLMRLGLITPGPETGSVRMHRLTQEVVRWHTLADVDGDMNKVGERDRWIVRRLRKICPEGKSGADSPNIGMVKIVSHMECVLACRWGGSERQSSDWGYWIGVKLFEWFLVLGGVFFRHWRNREPWGWGGIGPDEKLWIEGVGADLVAEFLALGADSQLQIGKERQAKVMLQRALAIQERKFWWDRRVVARTLCNLSNVYGALGDPAKQKELLERVLAIEEREFGRDHKEVATTLVNLGSAYSALGDPAKAKELIERAMEIEDREYGGDSLEVASTLNHLGNAHGALGEHEKKKELLERALKIKLSTFAADHQKLANNLAALGNAHGALGDPGQQKELLERALAIQVREFGPDHRKVASILVSLGNAHGALGDPAEQKKQHERALVILEREHGPDSRHTLNTAAHLVSWTLRAVESKHSHDPAAALAALNRLEDDLSKWHVPASYLALARSRLGGDIATAAPAEFKSLDGHGSLGISAATCEQLTRRECTRGTVYVRQLFHECRDCKIEFHRGGAICERCAVVCHAGHDLSRIPVLRHASCMCADLGKQHTAGAGGGAPE
jgi:tetratricopeptide (TPR) repeat protein